MGKKLGVNPKAAEARQKKHSAKSQAAVEAERHAQDAYWNMHDNPKMKRDKKKEEEVRLIGRTVLALRTDFSFAATNQKANSNESSRPNMVRLACRALDGRQMGRVPRRRDTA